MYNDGIENALIRLLDKSVGMALADLNITPTPSEEMKVELEIPKERPHGDISTNIALRLSKIARQQPLALANLIADKARRQMTDLDLQDAVEKIEVKHPGFINFFLNKSYLYKVLLEIKRRKADFGRASTGSGAKLQIEFVSANPTGPLTIAHGRQAAIGDSLANIMKFLGYNVTKEYYVNDEGTQMDILGDSIRIRYLDLLGIKEEFPENGYKGSYIVDIAAAFKKKYGARFTKTKDLKYFREFGLRWILNDIKKDLKDFGVKFDVWYSQRALRKSGKTEKTIALLKGKGHIFEQDQAVWFRSTTFGDDKDRVIIKADGKYTYLAPDMAYHLDKYRRKFKRIIDIWGPDHHGYIPRIKASMQALGYPEDSLSVLIVQLATLYRGGNLVSMSTRAGEFITLREVADEVGKDAARFSFLMRRISSHLDFDLEVVKSQSMENPVYYIQYAHARIWSILEHAKSIKVSTPKFNSSLLKEPEALEILRVLRQFPMVVNLSGKFLEPYVILQYLQDLAGVFHSFYTKHRVVGDDAELTKARLILVDCVRIVLANGLGLLGVSLPKKM